MNFVAGNVRLYRIEGNKGRGRCCYGLCFGPTHHRQRTGGLREHIPWYCTCNSEGIPVIKIHGRLLRTGGNQSWNFISNGIRVTSPLLFPPSISRKFRPASNVPAGTNIASVSLVSSADTFFNNGFLTFDEVNTETS